MEEVTACLERLYPLSGMPNNYMPPIKNIGIKLVPYRQILLFLEI
jgi:hypothetical protein